MFTRSQKLRVEDLFLAGHSSIPHSRAALGNRKCTYQGPTLFNGSEYEVVVPIGGTTRYYSGSMPLIVVPGSSTRGAVTDLLANFFPKVDGKLRAAKGTIYIIVIVLVFFVISYFCHTMMPDDIFALHCTRNFQSAHH